MKTTKHKLPKVMALFLAFTMTCIPVDSAFAAITQVAPPALTDYFQSSDNLENEYCVGQVRGSELHITLRTLIPSVQFRIALYGADPKTGVINPGIYVDARYAGTSSTGKSIYGMDYTLDFTNLQLPDGDYFLYISQLKNYGDTYENLPSKGALYKDMPVKIIAGMPYLLQNDDVIAENDRIRYHTAEAPDQYLDNTLEDVRFLLVDPATKVRETMDSYKISYIKRISDQVTAGAYSSYDKLLKIYEYTAENFYYDTIAFQTVSLQYANPYRNIYNHENRIKSPNSDYSGRVATTCQGFSGIFLALARAQGIPTRLVFGHHTTHPTYTWNTEGKITNRDHWWAESYVNGKWIMVDPTVGTNNKWNKNTGVWQYYGITNYTFFNPSKAQEASSHLAFRVYYNTYAGHQLTRKTEITKLTKFLETRTNGLSNGRRLNSAYTKSNKKTWGDGITDHFYGNGKGYTAKIIWDNFALGGSADFSDFVRLRILSLKNNQLTSLKLKNDGYLRTVDVQDNLLSTIDLTGCKKLTRVDTSGNKLQSYKIYANKRNTEVSVKGSNGYINFKYTKTDRYKLRTYFFPDLGYKVKGVFRTATGKKVASAKASYAMNPVSKSYYVEFEPDPNSFKYELRQNRNYGVYKEYNIAAQKRLADLGYYAGSADGYFGSEMAAAVTAFQTDYNIKDSQPGVIDQLTWSILFNPAPTPIVDEVPIEPTTPEGPLGPIGPEGPVEAGRQEDPLGTEGPVGTVESGEQLDSVKSGGSAEKVETGGSVEPGEDFLEN